MKLVFATHNKHKLSEVQRMLPQGLTFLTLDEIGCFEDIPETSTTIEGNAIQKAQYISALPLWVALLITLVSCYLLNSNLPLFSLKFKDFSLKKNAIKYIFLLLSLLLLLCFQINAFALIILAYILLSIGSNLFKNKDKNETI